MMRYIQVERQSLLNGKFIVIDDQEFIEVTDSNERPKYFEYGNISNSARPKNIPTKPMVMPCSQFLSGEQSAY